VRFEWDTGKAAANLVKHGVSFPEAATVFRDPLATATDDPDHSADEERFLTFGSSEQGRLLAIVHTERGDRIRVTSARPATRAERRMYEEG
jgi:hypothetical protein